MDLKVNWMSGLLCRKYCKMKLWPFLYIHPLFFNRKMWKNGGSL